MKLNIFIFFCGLLFTSSSSFSQIQVNSSGNIGMGSYDPTNAFTVRGESSYYDDAHSTYGYIYNSLGIGNGTLGHEATLYVNPTSSVGSVLYVRDNNLSWGRTLYVNGDALATQGWYTSSDKKTKKNVRNIEKQNLLSKLSKVRAKVYEYKSRKELLAMHNSGDAHFEVDTIFKAKEFTDKNGRKTKYKTKEIKDIVVDVPNYKKGNSYGVIAQDVLEVYPELVSMDESSGLYAVDYQGFIPLLLEGFNLQQDAMNEMREEIKQLKEIIKELKPKKGN